MDNLLWFHAFGGTTPDPGMVLSTLKKALTPNPDSDVRDDEVELKIEPPRVYAYLGRGHDNFGRVIVTIPFAKVDGDCSPFDSGGLLRKIVPVSTWEQEDKGRYLAEFTWSTALLGAKLNDYPGKKNLQRYLSGTRPSKLAGPHDVWPSKLTAPIWKANASWVCWTWEVRVPNHLSLGSSIFRWTCEPELFGRIQALAENAPPSEVDLYIHLTRTHVKWGIKALLDAVGEHQRAA
jgi:hypothetical protein